MKPADTKLTIEQCKDSGLALVLICLIAYLAWKLPFLVLLAMGFLLLSMTWPAAFQPFARLWFGLSTALGTVASKIILSLAFFVIVLPVGRVRRAMGKDSMQIRRWKKRDGSVFRVREHKFEAGDLEHPY